MLLFACSILKEELDHLKNYKPNIIFIMSDDQGYADLGCYGSPFVKTPHLDQMAAEGMRFTQVYAGSSVCAPSRCVLLTGQHSGHATRRDNRTSFDRDKPFLKRMLIPLQLEDYTIGEMMQNEGYKTGAFGKWGLGNPGTFGAPYFQGFDEFFGYLDQVHAHDHYAEYLMHNADTILIPENNNGKKRIYAHDLIVNKGLDFIRTNKDNPFFLYLPFTLPHGKYEVPDNSLYADKSWSEEVKNYAAMISRMDDDIGELFALLKELNLDDNTIVFFTSDNGPNQAFLNDLQSNYPFRGVKSQLLEGGIRMPMIARWPGKIKAGVISNFIWAFWDIMPTFADIVGATLPKEVDGMSILPTLLGEKQNEHDYLYWEYHSPFQQAVRINNWKGIRLGTKEDIHLFNLSNDIEEYNNAALENPSIVKQMELIMDREHKSNPYWPVVEKASIEGTKIFQE